MDELASRWYPAASLFLQAGFLIAAVWSVRAILKGVRASQEQMGTLLRLTVGGTHSDEDARVSVRPTPYLLDDCPEAANSAPTAAAATNQGRRRLWTGIAAWLQTPVATSGVSPWRRAVRWLQAPAGS